MKPFEVSWDDIDIAFIKLSPVTTADELAKELRTLLRCGEAVIVDLSEVEFLDSSVLHTLISTDRMARERGNTLTLLLHTSPIVRRLLELRGLEEFLTCVGSREHAIQAATAPITERRLRSVRELD